MKKQLIYNKYFSEFCYRVFRNAEESRVMQLPQDYQKHFASAEALLKFSNNASKEELDFVLSLLGVPWVQVYGPSLETITDAVLHTTLDVSDFPEMRQDLAARLAEDHIYATGSREAMMSLQMAATLSHTDAYSLSLRAQEMVLLGKKADWRVRGKDVTQEGTEAYMILNELLFLHLSSIWWAENNCDLKMHELAILSYLFQYKNKPVPYTQLFNVMKAMFSVATISVNLKKLSALRLIVSDKKGKLSDKTYLITALGIERIIKHRNFVHDLYRRRMTIEKIEQNLND